MSTEEILRKKLRRTPSVAVRISRDSFKARRDENRSNKDGFFDRDNGYKGKLNKNVNFKGKKYGEERSGEKFYERGEFRTSRNDENFDRENGYKGKLKKNVNFGRSRQRFYESGKSRASWDSYRTRNDETSDRENGYKGKLNKNVNFERSGEKFNESGKLRNLDSFGRKKRVYAKEGIDESVESWGGVETSKKKTLFKKREKKVRDKNGEGKTKGRTMWVRDKSKNVGSKDKISNHSLKDKKESDVLVTAKHKIKAMESGIDDGLKKIRDKKSDFGKEKSQEVDSPSFVKKQIRDKAGLDDDAERQDGRRWKKKKKRVMKIDPYDISNKRLDDAIVIEGSTEEPKKKDSLEELEISNRAQFRAIVPSPSILTFVEKNLLGRRRMIDIKRAGYNIELPAPLDNIPFSKSSVRENIEENIFRNRMEFFAAAKVSSSFPPPNLPEIAFAGKSNVGKSSLLNALTRQWGVVRTSPKPGHTQTINFFNLGTKLCLVDLPGYGFAYAKEEVKEAWDDLVKEYVSTRVGLKRVCLLIDSKWGLKPRDHELITLMERSKTNYQIVLTKTDTVFPIDVARRAMQIEEILLPNKSVVQPLMMASSKSGAGIRSLRTVLANVARFVKI